MYAHQNTTLCSINMNNNFKSIKISIKFREKKITVANSIFLNLTNKVRVAMDFPKKLRGNGVPFSSI